MEVKNNFEVKRDKDKIVIVQTITKEMSANESIQELAKLRTEATQMMQQKEQIQKAIQDQAPQKDLAKAIESVEILRKLEKKWQILVKEDEELLYQDLRGRVKVAKAEKGFDRISSEDQKIAVANQILGPIANELKLDMTHPVVARIRRDFMKI